MNGILQRINNLINTISNGIKTIAESGKGLLVAISIGVAVIALFYILWAFWKRRKPETKQASHLGAAFVLFVVASIFASVNTVNAVRTGGENIGNDVVKTITGP